MKALTSMMTAHAHNVEAVDRDRAIPQVPASHRETRLAELGRQLVAVAAGSIGLVVAGRVEVAEECGGHALYPQSKHSIPLNP
jgi:hypothetical protein